MLIYVKESRFKDSAGNPALWYTGTNSKGISCVVSFQGVASDKLVGFVGELGNIKCFNITNIKGNVKVKEVERNGEKYTNARYYVADCDFSLPPVQALDD